MIITDSFDQIFNKKKKVLVVMGHPDDTEIYCGGTVARLTHSAVEVRVVKMTYGEKGSKQDKIPENKLKLIREKEDKKAMKVLGIKEKNNIYLDLGDGAIENNLKTIEKVVRQIRLFKPDLIITQNPEDLIIRFDTDINWFNHRDHRNTAKVAIDAAYPYSRDISFFPEHFKDARMGSHTTVEFLFGDYYDHQDNVFIDVTDFTDIRSKALARHKSQYSLEDAKDSTEFFTENPKFPKGKRFEKFLHVAAD